MTASSARGPRWSVSRAWRTWLILACLIPRVFLLAAIVFLANGFGILFPWVWTVAGILAGAGLPAGAAIAVRRSA